jgi:hypothetical protein
MGILDEAIRAHLDLKRRQGAADEELKRLEDEAFGPPTRPGEPDFPDREGEGESQGNGSGGPSGDVATAEPDEAAGAPPTEETGAPLTQSEAAAPRADETEPVGPTTPEEPPPVEPPPVEEPPAEEPPPVEGEVEPEAPDEPAFYDQSQESELELGDLELEFDEEVAEPGEAPPPETGQETPISSLDTAEHEPPAESLDTAEHEPPIESLDTVEHHIEELEEEPVEPTPEPPEPSGEPEGSTGASEETSEDVLEETPEFLRDAPEDDELWFEQGEPKDFDFDD